MKRNLQFRCLRQSQDQRKNHRFLLNQARIGNEIKKKTIETHDVCYIVAVF